MIALCHYLLIIAVLSVFVRNYGAKDKNYQDIFNLAGYIEKGAAHICLRFFEDVSDDEKALLERTFHASKYREVKVFNKLYKELTNASINHRKEIN